MRSVHRQLRKDPSTACVTDSPLRPPLALLRPFSSTIPNLPLRHPCGSDLTMSGQSYQRHGYNLHAFGHTAQGNATVIYGDANFQQCVAFCALHLLDLRGLPCLLTPKFSVCSQHYYNLIFNIHITPPRHANGWPPTGNRGMDFLHSVSPAMGGSQPLAGRPLDARNTEALHRGKK